MANADGYRFIRSIGSNVKYALFNPRGVAVDGQKNVLVADTGNRCIKRYSSSGLMSTQRDRAGGPAFMPTSLRDVA